MLQNSSSSERVVCLALADGSVWQIKAGDKLASSIVSRLADAMNLNSNQEPTQRLLVLTHHHKMNRKDIAALSGLFSAVSIRSSSYHKSEWLMTDFCSILPLKEENSLICIFNHAHKKAAIAEQLIQLSQIICWYTQNSNQILVHGALAEREGSGVILAGPGGVGKTTASMRLPLSWRSLCDDTTLVVKDKQGMLWAHPWPTWSRFIFKGPGGTWDVQHGVPLNGIFFLNQAQKDEVEPMGAGQAACLLNRFAEQASRFMFFSLGKSKVRSLRLQQFENVCAIARTIPCFRLHLSMNGAFWQEIDRILTEQMKGTS
jgi:SynChlorMet cassette protein ScmC